MKNVTLLQKMVILGIFIIMVVLVTTIGKYLNFQDIAEEFEIYSHKTVASKIIVLEIERDLNYVSRCTRDTMLGNSYDKNIEKLDTYSKKIEKNFEALKEITVATPNETEQLAKIEDAKKSTMDFVNDGVLKMKALKDIDRTPEILAQTYQAYKKSATPLADASRKKFEKIIKGIDEDLKNETIAFHNTIALSQKIMMGEAVFVVVFILMLLGYLTRNILINLKHFQDGLLNFFSFLNREIPHPKPLDIDSKDEFGQMALIVNDNIKTIEKQIEKDNELMDEAKIVMARVTNGWYSQFIEKSTPNQSLENFKNNVNSMIEATRERFLKVDELLETYARYDYTKTMQMSPNDERGGLFERLVTGINTLQSAITQMLVDNKHNGMSLNESSQILLKNVNILNQNSNESAAALEETAAALEEITSTITNNANSVSQMATYSNEVSISAKRGQELAQNTTEAMDDITTQVHLINDAISVIDQIAFQTNILSLNAAVEAATAGEAGKGFAVVAGEVRNLATRSADAAKEIKDIVESATEKATLGKKISDEMIQGYDTLHENIDKTTQMIGEITTALQEQERGIVQINDAVATLDQQTQRNAMIASQTQDVAIQTDTIAKEIVSEVMKKEFVGKR